MHSTEENVRGLPKVTAAHAAMPTGAPERLRSLHLHSNDTSLQGSGAFGTPSP